MRGDAQTIPTMALRSADREGPPPLQLRSTLLKVGVQNRDCAPFNWVVTLDPRDLVVAIHIPSGSDPPFYVVFVGMTFCPAYFYGSVAFPLNCLCKVVP